MAPARVIRITDEASHLHAIGELANQCRHMRKLHKLNGTPPLREFPADFSGLAKIVTGQQLSAQSAAAIWARVAAAVQPFEAARLTLLKDRELAALGLSSGKIKTLRAMAVAVSEGRLNFRTLNRQDDAVIREKLTALHGIGPWTADIYLLFALRRADAFPPGDLALQLAAQTLFKLENRPNPAELTQLAERWRPWRGVAARLLWAEYGRTRTQAKSKSQQNGTKTP